MSRLLPLFPLDLVLFPNVAMPLHIFEPRYKEMIGELLQSKEKFGVVRATEQGVASVGCTADIVAVTKQYEDGRMDIVTEGRDRFEVMDINTERNFYRGEVLYFVDEPEPPVQDKIARLIEVHAEALTLLGATAEAPPADAKELSFMIAGAMPFDLDFKQTLLAMRSEVKRVEAVLEYYETILPSLRRAVKARRKSGGNGHV
ncbi:MAG: LON peptidase substrate-binding domain-containing protein [Terriglobales bacterium]